MKCLLFVVLVILVLLPVSMADDSNRVYNLSVDTAKTLNSSFGKITSIDNLATKNKDVKIDLSASLIFHEPFENTSTIANNGGSYSGSPSFSNGVLGNSVQFSGFTINYPVLNNLDKNEGTISFWVKPIAWNNGNPGGNGFFDYGSLGTASSFAVFRNLASNYVYFEAKDDDGNNHNTPIYKNNAVSIGKWTNIVIVYKYNSVGSNRMKLYIDGSLAMDWSFSSFPFNPSDSTFTVGDCGWYDGANSYIDELKIYDYIRSSANILDDYNAVLEQSKPNIISYIPEVNNVFCESGTSNFNITATALNPINITWYLDGSQVGTGDSYSLNCNSLTYDAHSLEVVVSDGNFQDEQKWGIVKLYPLYGTYKDGNSFSSATGDYATKTHYNGAHPTDNSIYLGRYYDDELSWGKGVASYIFTIPDTNINEATLYINLSSLGIYSFKSWEQHEDENIRIFVNSDNIFNITNRFFCGDLNRRYYYGQRCDKNFIKIPIPKDLILASTNITIEAASNSVIEIKKIGIITNKNKPVMISNEKIITEGDEFLVAGVDYAPWIRDRGPDASRLHKPFPKEFEDVTYWVRNNSGYLHIRDYNQDGKIEMWEVIEYDMDLIRMSGSNTIRTYASGEWHDKDRDGQIDEDIYYIRTEILQGDLPNWAFDRILDYGLQNNIKTIVGYWVQDEDNKDENPNTTHIEMEADAEDLVIAKETFGRVVQTYKDHPAVLGWGIGNEVNLPQNHEWFNWTVDINWYLNELNNHTRSIDDNNRPVMYTKYVGEETDFDISNADIMAINAYTHPANDTDLLAQFAVEHEADEAYLMGEFGHHIEHAEGHWDIAKQYAGGCFLEYSDVWWKGINDQFGIVDQYRGINHERWGIVYYLYTNKNQTCSDGSLYGMCSSKPQYCNSGVLENKCLVCGCEEGYICENNGSCGLLGNISSVIIEPSTATNVSQNGVFTVTTAVSCQSGYCGNIKVILDPIEIEEDSVTIGRVDMQKIAEVKDKVDELNEEIRKKGKKWEAGFTQQAFYSDEQREALLSGVIDAKQAALETHLLAASGNMALPETFDWRDKDGYNWVTSVKDQAFCGSCWAFAALGAVEAAFNVLPNEPGANLDLSEQELVSCSGAGNCIVGGHSYLALDYVKDNGIVDESCFSYTALDSPCTLCADHNDRRSWIFEYQHVLDTQEAYKEALIQYGPFVVGLDAHEDLFYYVGGIYEPLEEVWDGVLNHAVLLVGYNDTGDYWIIKNSWGTGWGDNGYGKVAYGNLVQYDYGYAVTDIQFLGVIPMYNGTPFYTNDLNPTVCFGMDEGDSCNKTWIVHATGNGTYEIFTKYQPYLGPMARTSTEKVNITITGNCTDNDNDGFCIPIDCNDHNNSIHPGAPELCNGVDDNCNSNTDEGGNSLCTDSLYCNGQEICSGISGCQAGAPVSCTANNIPAIHTCTNNPDNNSYTYDSRESFTSSCIESTDSCSTGSSTILHNCNIPICSAPCDGTETHGEPACIGNDLYTVVEGCNSACNWDDNAEPDILLDNCVRDCTPDQCISLKWADYDDDSDLCIGESCYEPAHCTTPATLTCNISCGAECEINLDCNDSNPNTIDTCLNSCTCQYQSYSLITPPSLEWNRTFGGDQDDIGYSVQQTIDGGYIVGGTTESFGNGTWNSRDIYVIKTNLSGDMEWNRTFGGEGDERRGYVLQTSDGGYIIAGSTNSFGVNYSEIYLIRLNSSGDKEWEKTFGTDSYDAVYDFKKTNNNGYIVLTHSKGSIYLFKLNSTGDDEWVKSYGGSGDFGKSVQQTTDQGFIIVGTKDLSYGKWDEIYLIKTDTTGNVEWEKTFGGPSWDAGTSVQQTSDGGYIVVGKISNFGYEMNEEIYLVKTNSSGIIEWEKAYGGTISNTLCSYQPYNPVQQTLDGGFIILGPYFVPNDCWNRDFNLIKTDFSGNFEWEKTFGTENDDHGKAVQQTSDRGFIVTGSGATSGPWDPLIHLVKFSNETYESCSDGTPYGFCSSQIPLFCDNGILVDNCNQCDCSAGDICQSDGSCQQGTCSADSDCGEDRWVGETYCCLDDVCRRYKNYTCNSQTSTCFSTEKSELKEECPASYCDDWGSVYCGQDGNLLHNRTCYDKGCLEGECKYNIRPNEGIAEYCQYNCEGNSCRTEPDETNLIFYESFDNETSVLSNNGTINGDIEFVETRCGKAVDMTSNSYISYPLEENFPALNKLTIEFWFKNTKLNSQGFFDIARLYGTHPNSMGIFYSTSFNVNRVITEIRNNYTSMYQAHAPGSLIGYKWNHVAMTFSDYVDNCFKVTTYFNGNPGGAVNVCKFYPNMSRDFWVGLNYYYGYSNAYMDEFKIFNYAKSDDEIYNDYLYMRNCTKEEIPPKECIMYKPESTGPVKINCSGLYVNNELFTTKGVGYQPIPIGLTADVAGGADVIFNSPEIYNRDFPLLRQMNANTIRTWAPVTNRSFLDAAYNNGTNPIYVAMGFWMDCSDNMADAAVRQNYIDEFSDYVAEYKDHPAVLVWLLGNENNLCLSASQIDDWYSLSNEMAKAAYEIEGSSYHPVGIVNWDIFHIGYDIYNSDDESLNYTDFWGSNVYPGETFGTWFEDYSSMSGKPLLITEYGIDALNNSDRQEYEDVQADWDLRQWSEINNASMTIGSTLMAYSDEWWKASGSNWNHDYGGYLVPRKHPDDFSNEEWWGVMRTVNNDAEPDIMQPRKVYYALQYAWGEKTNTNITLNEGWNLISIPLVLENNTLPNDLSSIEGNYGVIFSYDAFDTGNEWKSYNPDRPAFLNTLTELSPEYGYWIKMNNSDSLEIEGVILESAVIDLANGWNLIGYPSLEENNATDVFEAINDQLELVFMYDAFDIGNEWKSYNPDRPPFLNTLTTVEPGYGYWVKVDQDTSLPIS